MYLNKSVFRLGLFIALSMTLSTSAWAQTTHISSTATQTMLLELYTSEGCSSCPPADHWLSKFKQDSRLWHFHVDYWDYLGWRDRFAKAEYTQRQQHYQQQRAIRFVYTPGMVLNGREWRGWFDKQALPDPGKHQVGVLSAHINNDNTSVEFTPLQSHQQPLKLHVAWLGFDLESQVGGGENSGRSLNHDFVVLEMETHPASVQADTYRWQLANNTPARKAQGIAIWVTELNDPTPIQTIGGWLQ